VALTVVFPQKPPLHVEYGVHDLLLLAGHGDEALRCPRQRVAESGAGGVCAEERTLHRRVAKLGRQMARVAGWCSSGGRREE
jgi:hypothetical protein